MLLTVGNLKGGAGKTTTAVYLAAGLARHGRTLLVDADPQASAFRWSEHAGESLGVSVIPWPTRDLARRVRDVAGDYAHVVIDTGPRNDAVLRQALLATGRLLIPVGPSAMEWQQLRGTLDAAAEIDGIVPVELQVLLARVRAGTRSAAAAREILAGELALPVLDTAVHLREHYATAHGTPAFPLGEYDSVLAELAGVDLVEDELRRRS